MADFPEIPGCKITSVLGKGGMATVYLGIQEELNRKVAIKVVETSLMDNEKIASRFDKEAKTAASLSHSNIIQIFDNGQFGDHHYIVMEYLEESLKEQMKRVPQNKFKPGIALDIVKELMKALDSAHLNGVYHRDIKPENIMFRKDSTPVLVDFGIARVFDSQDQLTVSGMTIGTVYYMSPELCKAKSKVDGRSDIYSLGVILFEMLTGKKPYKGETAISTALQHIEKPVPRLPRGLSHYQPLIEKMMAKNKEKRFSSAPQYAKLRKKISRKKLGSSVENMKEKLGLSMGKKIDTFIMATKKTWNSFKNFLLQKKIVFGVLPAILLAVIIFAIIHQGSKSSAIEAKAASQLINKFFRQVSQYKKNLLLAYDLYQKGDLESLKEALKSIYELKKIKPNPQINELEKKINHRIEELENEFNEYYTASLDYFYKKNLPKAYENILKAKKIKITEELTELENVVFQKLIEKPKISDVKEK